ncbi:hypothetical protein N7G274_007656 [Stereocaulon virgatum]|uniref:Uncharacterized protein n=1 Tax=Stereocaulon virgatum TaxID=373712 RepID=A0ABR4A5X3_9LECA
MLDTFRLLHGGERISSYRPRNGPWGTGIHKVGLILATKGLRERIRQADVLDSELERGPSDHVPLSINVHVDSRKLDAWAIGNTPIHDLEDVLLNPSKAMY